MLSYKIAEPDMRLGKQSFPEGAGIILQGLILGIQDRERDFAVGKLMD